MMRSASTFASARAASIVSVAVTALVASLASASRSSTTQRRVQITDVVLRGYAETVYRAKSWSKARRACARIEATTLGLDIRYVVTNLAMGSAESIYDTLYCARGQAENLIKMANQISQFFDGDASEAEAVADIRNHLQRFWAPSMREALCAALALCLPWGVRLQIGRAHV